MMNWYGHHQRPRRARSSLDFDKMRKSKSPGLNLLTLTNALNDLFGRALARSAPSPALRARIADGLPGPLEADFNPSYACWKMMTRSAWFT
jgi:hypothetical protein